MSSALRPISILLVGGCGHWAAAENHLPAILTLKKHGAAVRLAAICDPRDPYDPALLGHMPYLNSVVTEDRPAWIRPQPGEPTEQLECRLQQAHREHHFDVIIVACDPVAHFPYLKWATDQGIHVLCDKPIICVEDAAWNPDRAAEIRRQFDALLRAHRAQPGHLFAVPLRRRANDAFVRAGQLIRDLHDTHQQPLTMGHINVYGGHFRLPEEYALGQAHGYTHGVGALAFSSYHYLDEMTRYLLLAPGQITGLRLTLQYVRRVGDHLASGLNDALGALLRPLSEAELPDVKLDDRTLLAEMDFAFTVELLNARQQSLGVLNYSFTSNSLSNRRVGVLARDAEGSLAFREKGRMSQYVMDLHQGNLQHLRLTKNDAVGEAYRIRLEHRRNPLIGGTGRQKTVYDNAHEASAVTPQDITAAFITMAAGGTPTQDVVDKIAFLDGQLLTHRVFAAMYELIAAHHHDTRPCPSVLIDMPVTGGTTAGKEAS
ncbi:Gfo/Idh/MocA family oxidoreductase [Streptomyces cavernae]|uniref:Gfo/Idh/MocA family oxidoreductase n=1 Tax=Streptomyces cavernae TaxID=2259034 RepID=UPI000FEBBCC4|nr:Gfo/Idh/MocA family oxidoreductase [Streptomyces cavernae]